MEQKTEASQAVKFRKKPVEIEAIQWTGKLDCLDAFNIPELHQSLGSKNVGIPTLEGTMIAHVGDWIIKGVKGEFYPCKPDIFELTYERAALKAQPAPTEAARDRIPMPTNADQAELMQKLGLAWLQTNAPDRLTDAGRAAQGEDSARLDALEKLRDIAGKLGEVGRWKTAGAMHEAIDVIAAIDRARASAETGGVKP